MILNPVLYFSLSYDVEIIISRSLAQFTNKERQIVDVIKLKFLLINFSFYLCWLPNLVNGILIWSFKFSPHGEIIVMLWYLMVSFYLTPCILHHSLCNCKAHIMWDVVPHLHSLKQLFTVAVEGDD